MAEIYGASFAASYGDVPPPIWLDAISRLTDEQCARGFRALANEGREFAPNLTQFVSACKQMPSSPRFLGTPIDPHAVKTLGAPVHTRARVEDIDDWLGSMRENVSAAVIKVNPAYAPRRSET